MTAKELAAELTRINRKIASNKRERGERDRWAAKVRKFETLLREARLAREAAERAADAALADLAAPALEIAELERQRDNVEDALWLALFPGGAASDV